MKLLLVRHGTTEGKDKGLILGHLDEGLNEKGKKEAEKLAQNLKKQKIDVIYSSDLKRAKQTAEIINRYHNVDILTSKKFREMDFGTLEGKPKDIFENEIKRVADPHLKKFGGAESFADVQKRASRLIEKIIRENKNKTVMIVSHGVTIMEILFYLTKSPRSEWKRFLQKRTALNILEIDCNRHVKIKLLNSTKHLS